MTFCAICVLFSLFSACFSVYVGGSLHTWGFFVCVRDIFWRLAVWTRLLDFCMRFIVLLNGRYGQWLHVLFFLLQKGTSKSSMSGSIDLTQDKRRRRHRRKRISSDVPKPIENQHLSRKIESGELSFVPVQALRQEKEINSLKRPPPATITPILNDRPIKRVKLITISDQVSITTKANIDIDEDYDFGADDPHDNSANDVAPPDVANTSTNNSTSHTEEEKTPITEAFATLLEACRNADSSEDMELLIKKKLTRYYHTVHPDFVNSKSFSKTALSVAAEINANPSLVYLKLTGILEELNIRRKSGQTVVSNEDVASTGNAKKDLQIKRLNKALYILKKKIAQLDEAGKFENVFFFLTNSFNRLQK